MNKILNPVQQVYRIKQLKFVFQVEWNRFIRGVFLYMEFENISTFVQIYWKKYNERNVNIVCTLSLRFYKNNVCLSLVGLLLISHSWCEISVIKIGRRGNFCSIWEEEFIPSQNWRNCHSIVKKCLSGVLE